MRRYVLLAALGLALTACSSGTEAATTVTSTESGIVSTETIVTTAVSTITEIESTTLTPEPAGTVTKPAKTVVKTVVNTKEVTITADPPAPATDAVDGSYLVGVDLQAGTYHCDTSSEDTFWRISDSAGETIENGFGSTAFITPDAFTADLKRCTGGWVKIA